MIFFVSGAICKFRVSTLIKAFYLFFSGFFSFLARYYAIPNTIGPLPAIQKIRYVHNSSVTEDTSLKMLKTQVKPLKKPQWSGFTDAKC